jgi:hypothetical protein
MEEQDNIEKAIMDKHGEIVSREPETNMLVGKGGRITVPEYLREEYNIEQGDRIDAVFLLERAGEGDSE